MIRSQYTNFIPRIDGVDAGVLIHSVTGAIDVVSNDLYDWFNQSAPVEQISSSHRSRLLFRGHIFDGSLDEEHRYFQDIATKLHAHALAATRNSFWIIPTYKCNLRCSYCFQDHSLHRGHGLANRDMTPQEGMELIDRLDAFGGPGSGAANSRGRYITLFGGEPLMDCTLATVEAIVRHATRKGYRIGAVTNGVELDRFRNLLGPGHIRWLQITMDGLQPLHEKRRIPIQGGSFDAIVRGIGLALRQGVKVSLRTNADQMVAQRLKELEEWAHTNGWTSYRNFSWYAAPVETHTNPSLAKVSIDVPELISIVRRERLHSIKAPYLGKYRKILSTLVKHGIASRIETSACGAHTGMYFFDPHGNIFACAEQVGRPNLAIGHLSDGAIPTGRDQTPWMLRYVGNMPVCSHCSNAFFCGGGCANAALHTTGNFFGPRCNGIKSALETVAREFSSKALSRLGFNPKDGLPSLVSVNDDKVLLRALTADDYVARVTCVLP